MRSNYQKPEVTELGFASTITRSDELTPADDSGITDSANPNPNPDPS